MELLCYKCDAGQREEEGIWGTEKNKGEEFRETKGENINSLTILILI